MHINIPHESKQRTWGGGEVPIPAPVISSHPWQHPQKFMLSRKVLTGYTLRQPQCCLWEGEEGTEIGAVINSLSLICDVLILLEEKYHLCHWDFSGWWSSVPLMAWLTLFPPLEYMRMEQQKGPTKWFNNNHTPHPKELRETTWCNFSVQSALPDWEAWAMCCAIWGKM